MHLQVMHIRASGFVLMAKLKVYILQLPSQTYVPDLTSCFKRDKVFKNEPNKICERQSLKNLKRYGLF